MKLKIGSQGQLILRDGRPFGEAGSLQTIGVGFGWPLPQTIAGMVRSAVGLSVGPDYFNDDTRNELKKVKVTHQLIFADKDGSPTPLVPVPQDCFFSDTPDGKVRTDIFSYDETALLSDEGTDISYKSWVLPLLKENVKGKPSKKAPVLVTWDFFSAFYLHGKEPPLSYPEDIGFSSPISTSMVHTGINSQTGTAQDSQLFAQKEVFLSVKAGERNIPLEITMDIDDIPAEAQESFLSKSGYTMYLGGERKTVYASLADEKGDYAVPSMPLEFNNKKYLKLVLVTPGNFGGWCPDWLHPETTKGNFVTLPDIGCGIRLVSAVVAPWVGVSGWEQRGHSCGFPKAMCKLVPAGSVYVIEIEKPELSQEVASFFWGASLCDVASQEYRDGYGFTFVANV